MLWQGQHFHHQILRSRLWFGSQDYKYARTNSTTAEKILHKQPCDCLDWSSWWDYIQGRCCHSGRRPPSSPQVGWAVPAGQAAPPGLPSLGSGWLCVCCRGNKETIHFFKDITQWKGAWFCTSNGGKKEGKTDWIWLPATYQFGRGHPILLDVSLQISRQLQGHLTYFFPVGGFLMGWKATHKKTTQFRAEQKHERTMIWNVPNQ